MNPAYILSTNYEKLYELIEAGATVAGFVTTESYTNDIVQIRNNGVGDLQIWARGIIYGEVPNYWKDYQPEASAIGLFKASCQSLHLQYIVPNAGQVEELVKAGLEPLEPFTAEFLSMMLTLGISRLTEAQMYALADGLLERLPERPNYWKQRCLLAEKCMEESPCDPDMTTAQIEAHKEYNEFLSNQKNPEGE